MKNALKTLWREEFTYYVPEILTTEAQDVFEKIALCGNELASSDVLVNAKCFVHPDLNEVIG